MSQSIRVPAILLLETPRSLLNLVSWRPFTITCEECSGIRGSAIAEAACAASAPRNPALFEIKANSEGQASILMDGEHETGLTIRITGAVSNSELPPCGLDLRQNAVKSPHR